MTSFGVPTRSLKIPAKWKIRHGESALSPGSLAASAFLPLLARKTSSDVLHNEFEERLSDKARRTMLSHFLNGWFNILLYRFEGIDLPQLEPDDDARRLESQCESANADEERCLQRFAAYSRRGADAYLRFWRKLGVLEKEHMETIRPSLRYLRSVIDKHKVGSEAAPATGVEMSYHFDSDVLDFFFAWESGHLKLIGLFCRQ